MKKKNLLKKFCVLNSQLIHGVKVKQQMTNLPFGFKGTNYVVFPKNDGVNGGEGLSHFSDTVPIGFKLISEKRFLNLQQ